MSKTPSPVRSAPAASTAAASAICTLLIACVLAGCVTGAADSPPAKRSRVTPPPWPLVKVDLPVSNTYFPAGDGADAANAQCLICHSAGMVLRQPPLTHKEWVGEINKMRNSYGALIPVDQIDSLATYLHKINAR
jgi:mono/diheme cytochrome c family protein